MYKNQLLENLRMKRQLEKEKEKKIRKEKEAKIKKEKAKQERLRIEKQREIEEREKRIKSFLDFFENEYTFSDCLNLLVYRKVDDELKKKLSKIFKVNPDRIPTNFSYF